MNIEEFINILTNNVFLQAIICASISVICILLYFYIFKYDGVAYFLRKQSHGYVLVKKKKFRRDKTNIRVGNKTFPLDLTKTAYLNPTKTIIFYDYDNGGVLTFENVAQNIDVEFLDTMVSKSIIAQLVSKLALNPFSTISIIMLIMSLCLGILLGITIQPYLPKPPVNATGG